MTSRSAKGSENGKHGPLRTPMASFTYKGRTPSCDGAGNVVQSPKPSSMAPIQSPMNGPKNAKGKE